MNVKTRLLKLEQMKHSLSIGVFEVLLVNDDVYTYLGSPYVGAGTICRVSSLDRLRQSYYYKG